MAELKTKDEAELTPEELKKIQDESDEIERKKKEKKEAGGKSYTKDEVDALLRKAIADLKKGDTSQNELDDDEPYKIKKLTIPRFKSKDGTYKFIVGFANTNTDEYFKDKIVYAFDIWDDLQKRNVPYVKVIFQDGEELSLPLLTVIKKSQKVLVDIVEIKKVDQSYSAGRTEKRTVEGYTTKAEGTVPMKVVKFDYSFVVKLPDGKEVEVQKDVVNWQIISDSK